MSAEKLFTHVADIAQVEGLQIAEATSVVQDRDGYNLAVGHLARAVAVTLAGNRNVFSILARKTSTLLHFISQHAVFVFFKWV